ncbi:serine/arginine repetitive matrix protein 1-like [Centropristis striata]|uniref:serine/arginine repetitive matrix protein 1-like n=1 Tax=Centropristis striata TaxID=184440 RepID=UPI0027E13D98|nr:serine/arginine repetitive matrix protein 1-like [Centropristis striata]
MTVSPDLYSANSHMMMSPDVYSPNGYLPRPANEQPVGGGYLPSVSYSLDHLDRLDYQGREMLPYQPNSESCLIGCYNTDEMEPGHFHRQSDYRPSWRSDRVLGYLPLSELDSGLGCGPDSPHHRVPFSEAETDAMSSLPGHTPSSQGSSSSSESLISSEPSDSGFHSVSTGEHRRLHKIHSHAHRQPHHLRSGHSPREQRGRWDLESIPETTPMTHSGAPQASRCTVGNSTTTTVHFHRAERSPTLPRHRSPPSPSVGCRTEPCQRRALWLEQQQGGGGMMEAPGRSQTITDLSEGQRRRRASHPNTADPDALRTSLQSGQQGGTSSTLGPRSRASYPSHCPPSSHLSIDRTSLTNQQNALRSSQAGSRSREDDSLSKSPGSGSSGASDWRGIQTLGNRPNVPKGSSASFYSTLGAPQHKPHSPPSPRSRLSNQKSVRNQLLRARAYRLARERSEVTTDEEVRGEGERDGEEEGEDGRWAGRYCSRTERRRHLALSRQHRERRGVGEELAGGLQGALSSQTVLELSHRKQNRLRNSKLLDDWTTVEELLTHGTRVESDSQLCPSPLLSVTTV